ncbi:calcium-binding protein 7 isoform X1 [Alligator mississippiensis]|uniref:calcium-binding protein 7 isoform X1 n=1 Tax=Alligator mississippiensis TaxID=8496 RepID=UPI0009070AB1|nr:calcium-binding protein 7 isoform X1 [Alligator mississippiensis]
MLKPMSPEFTWMSSGNPGYNVESSPGGTHTSGPNSESLSCVKSIWKEIREAFKVFDRDGNGFISKQELGTAMRSLGYMPNEVELEVIIQRLDMDGDGQVDFEEFVTLLGPKLSTSGIPEKFHGTDFDTVFWKCDMQKLTVDELKRLLYDTFCEHLSMKDIENIIMTEEESHMGNAEECPVDVESKCPLPPTAADTGRASPYWYLPYSHGPEPYGARCCIDTGQKDSQGAQEITVRSMQTAIFFRFWEVPKNVKEFFFRSA